MSGSYMCNQKNVSHALGFTLVELVVVIAILGILAATALPRFANISKDARINSIKQLEGAVKEAATQWRYSCKLDEVCDVTGVSLLTRLGTTVQIFRGWPDAGIGPNQIQDAIDVEGFTINNPDNLRTRWQKDGAPDIATCYVEYVEPLVDGSVPTYNTVITGC